MYSLRCGRDMVWSLGDGSGGMIMANRSTDFGKEKVLPLDGKIYF